VEHAHGVLMAQGNNVPASMFVGMASVLKMVNPWSIEERDAGILKHNNSGRVQFPVLIKARRHLQLGAQNIRVAGLPVPTIPMLASPVTLRPDMPNVTMQLVGINKT
jgi:hypothetical protein